MKSKRYLAGLAVIGSCLVLSGCSGGNGLEFQPVQLQSQQATEFVYTANAASLSSIPVFGESLGTAVTFPTGTGIGNLSAQQISALSSQPVALTVEGGFANVGAYSVDGSGNLAFLSDQTGTVTTTFGDSVGALEPGPIAQQVVGANTVAYIVDSNTGQICAFTVQESGSGQGNLAQLGTPNGNSEFAPTKSMQFATAGGNPFLLTFEDDMTVESWALNSDGSINSGAPNRLFIDQLTGFTSNAQVTGAALFTSGGNTFMVVTGDEDQNNQLNCAAVVLNSDGSMQLTTPLSGETNGTSVIGVDGTAPVGVVVQATNQVLTAIVTSADGTETPIPLNPDGTFGTAGTQVSPGNIITNAVGVGTVISSSADPNLSFLIVSTGADQPDFLAPVSTASGSIVFGTPTATGDTGATLNAPLTDGSAAIAP